MVKESGTSAAQAGRGAGPVLLVFDRVNAYNTRLLDGIRSVLTFAGVPFVVYVHDSFATEIRPAAKRLVESGELRGVITTMLSDGPSQTDLSNMFDDGLLPTVHIGSATENGWSVGVDNASSMHALMCHVLDDVGARRIALVRGPSHHPDSREREEIACAELRARGLDAACVIEGGFDRDVAYNSTTMFLQDGALPDAIVALNDRSALGVLDALADAQIKIPTQISVTGFDDEAIARRCTPTLTTVSQELFAQGALAAQLLLRQIRGAPPSGHVLQPGQLIIRDSTGQDRSVQTPDPGEATEQSEQLRAVAAMDRALSINRAFMACRNVPDLLSAVGANIARLGLRRCFIVLNEHSDEALPSSGVLALLHTNGRTQVTPHAQPFPLADVLPRPLRNEIKSGNLALQPLAVDDLDLGYVLFEEIEPDRYVGELLGTDLSRTIDSLQRSQQQARALESLVALRTGQLQAEVAVRSRTEGELRDANQELLRLTRLDGLTGIANRATFDHYLNQQWTLHLAEQRSLSILLIDIDRFKQHNDQYGHVSGDECLRSVARAMRDAIWSPADLAARYGGDEFVAVLPHTDAHGAAAVAERLMKLLRALHGSTDIRSAPPFTVSIGTATLVPRATMRSHDLVALADSALYTAKRAGRDRRVAAN